MQFPVFLVVRFCRKKRSHTRFRCRPWKRQLLLSYKMEGKLNSVPKFAPIWYHYIKPQRIHQLSKFIQQRREEPIERFSWIFSLRFSQFSYPFISSTSNYVNITLFEKFLQVVGSILQYLTSSSPNVSSRRYKREKHTSRHQ